MAENEDRLSALEQHVAQLTEQNRRLMALVGAGEETAPDVATTTLLPADDGAPATSDGTAPAGHPRDGEGTPDGGGGLDRRSALRGLGTAAAAAVGLVAANGAVRPSAASAADGESLTVGRLRTGSSATRLRAPVSSSGDDEFRSTFSSFNEATPASDETAYALRGRAGGLGNERSFGVIGQSDNGTGVRGENQNTAGSGVHGESLVVGGVGVLGEATGDSTATGSGVHGLATGRGGDGVFGEAAGDSTTPGYGVRGQVSDDTRGGAAVRGTNTGGGYAVEGRSQEPGGVGVYGFGGGTLSENFGTGVLARADYGTPLRLSGASIAVPPTSGSWDAGSFLFRDGELWLCEASGSPGTWRRLYSSGFSNFLEFITPTRVFNTLSGGKNHPGTQGDPLVGDPDNPYTIDISGELPARATAMYASVTAVPVDENGWISAWESGPWPVTANLTWRQGENITNLSLVGLTDSHTFELTLQENQSSHVVVDVLAIVASE